MRRVSPVALFVAFSFILLPGVAQEPVKPAKPIAFDWEDLGIEAGATKDKDFDQKLQAARKKYEGKSVYCGGVPSRDDITKGRENWGFTLFGAPRKRGQNKLGEDAFVRPSIYVITALQLPKLNYFLAERARLKQKVQVVGMVEYVEETKSLRIRAEQIPGAEAPSKKK